MSHISVSRDLHKHKIAYGTSIGHDVRHIARRVYRACAVGTFLSELEVSWHLEGETLAIYHMPMELIDLPRTISSNST